MTKAQRKTAIDHLTRDARTRRVNAKFWLRWTDNVPSRASVGQARAEGCTAESRALFAAAKALRKVATDD